MVLLQYIYRVALHLQLITIIVINIVTITKIPTYYLHNTT